MNLGSREQPPPEPASEAAIPKPGKPIDPRRGLLIGYACAALGAALFSAKVIFIKLAYEEGVSTETLLAYRMLLSLPAYVLVGVLTLRTRHAAGIAPPSRALLLRVAGVGILGYWFASYMDFLGIAYISAQLERLILFTYPAFVVLFGAMFFGQRVRSHAVVGIAISYAGLALIFTADFGEAGTDVVTGSALVLASAIGFALYQLFAKGLIGQIGPQLFTCIAMSAAAAVVILQFVLMEPLSSLLVSPKVLAYSVILALGATVAPTFLLNAALQRISAQANGTIGTLSPVVTILLSVAILGEPFGWIDALGTALVLAGVGWFTLSDRRR